MKNIIFPIFLLLFISVLNAQQITNVKAKTSSDNKTIIVTYDVLNSKTEQTFNISLWISKNGSTYKKLSKNELSGHIGIVKVNDNAYKKSSEIIYDPLKYNEHLQGNIEFEVRANVSSSGSIEMVFVKGGSFTMGSTKNEENTINDETQHRVTVSNFYIGKYEVTQKQWKEIMGTNPSYFKGDSLPIEQVSWNDVQNFIKKLNTKTGQTYRLPTEAEWEYACRAGATTTFNTGNCISTSQANYNGNYPYKSCNKGTYRQNTTTVGSFSPNAWGIYDMHGNVMEWCSDWLSYSIDYYKNSPTANPQGALSGSCRVTRGGSWKNDSEACRSANRGCYTPGGSGNSIGFRMVFVQ